MSGATGHRTLTVLDQAQETNVQTGPWPAEADDGALLARVARQDQQAYRALVERHVPAVLALARRMLRDDAEAEDIAQETFLRLWRSGASLEIGTHGLRPWLKRVATNLCIDRIRTAQRLTVTDEVPETPVAPKQHDTMEQTDLAHDISAAMADLPDRQRAALTLFHHEGLSQKEIATTMEISVDAVESLLSRARRSLKTTLAPAWRDLTHQP